MDSLTSFMKQSKLPDINQAQSRSPSANTPTQVSLPKQKFDHNLFQKTIEKVKIKLQNNDKIDNELQDIKNELIKAIVHTLMSNKDHDWELLQSLLNSIKFFSKYLDDDLRLNHYCERIYFYTSRTLNRPPCKIVYETLADTFTKSVSGLRESTKKETHFPTTQKPQVEKLESIEKKCEFVPDPNIDFYDGKLNPYKNKLKNIQFKKEKGPTLNDIAKTIPKVALDSFHLETPWKNKPSNLAVAANVDFDDLANKEKKAKKKVLFTDVDEETDSFIDIEYQKMIKAQVPPDFAETCVNMTGRDLIPHLIKLNHLGEVRSYFLNYSNDKRYRPYDLVTVPHCDVNSEYYIFSVFGILHVLSENESENFTLDEWNRHAVLWEACKQIKFFKKFLYNKFFARWRLNSKFSKFVNLKKIICKDIILCIPDYAESLVHINELILQILTIKLLPNEQLKETSSTDITPQILNLDKFMDIIYTMNVESEKQLQRFFVFIKYVLNETRANYYKKFHYYVQLINQHEDMNDPRYPISYKKAERQRYKERFDKLLQEIGLLGNFLNLVSVMLSCNLLNLQRTQTDQFIDAIIECTQMKREAIFAAELTFDENDKFVMHPTKDKYLSTIVGSVVNVSSTISEASRVVDFKGVLRDIEKYGIELEKTDLILTHDEQEIERIHKQQKLEQSILMENRRDVTIKKPILKPKEAELDETLILQRLVIPIKEKLLKVQNISINAQANELRSMTLNVTLSEDPNLKKNIDTIKRIVDDATNDVEQFCKENAWLSEIKSFITKWSIQCAIEWKNQGAYMIEDELNRIRTWIENVRNMDKVILTTNRVFKIDCSSIEIILVGALESIYTEICEYCVKENVREATEFIGLISKITKELDKRAETIEDFANYARMVYKHKSNTNNYNEKFILIKSLFEIIRVGYRALNGEEELLESQSIELWKAFIFKLQESLEFVTLQAPDIVLQLNNLIKQYIAELEEIYKKGTSGKFTDPFQDCSKILSELKTLCYEFDASEKILRQCISWKQSISSQEDDMTNIEVMFKSLKLRKDLWKYYEVTFHHIKDWKNMPVKKISVKQIEEKLKFWEEEAQRLHKHLDEDDKVWLNWFGLLQSFNLNMRWISKLASNQFKTKHFEELFSAIGLTYDETRMYTIQELIDLHLDDFVDLINRIYKRAHSELKLIEQFNLIEQFWSTKLNFNLAKHFSSQFYKEDKTKAKASAPVTNTQRHNQSKERMLMAIERQRTLFEEVTYKLVDINEVRYYIEDSLIRLNVLLQSPIVHLIQTKVETLISKLNTILFLSELWLSVQHKWLYLEKVLHDSHNTKNLQVDEELYEQASSDLKTFHSKIVADPLVFHILKHDNLRTKLTEFKQKFDKILSSIERNLERACIEFPRFYFINKDQLIETLSYSRDCRKFLNTIRLCFPGVCKLTYKLPKSVIDSITLTNNAKVDGNGNKETDGTTIVSDISLQSVLDTHFNFDIFANELEVESIIGYNQIEKIDLIKPLSSPKQDRTAKWFESFLKLMKCSVSKLTQDYLNKLSKYDDYTTLSVIPKRLIDITGTPIQSILLAESLIWTKNIRKIIETNQLKDFKYAINYLQKSINECSNAFVSAQDDQQRDLYRNLVVYYVYQKELTQEIIKIENLNRTSYEWLRAIKYECDVKAIPNRKYNSLNETVTVSFSNSFENIRLVQMSNSVLYDYEYFDLSKPLAITPLTEKCFLTLMNSLNAIKCGGIASNDGNGKRSTIDLLAQLCGQHMFTVNCSEFLGKSILVNYIKGFVSAGSWLLFDKYDSLTTNNLCYVAHELEHINNSVKTFLNERHSDDGPKHTRSRSVDSPKFNIEGNIKILSAYKLFSKQSFFNNPYIEHIMAAKKKLKKPSPDAITNQIDPELDAYYKKRHIGYVRYDGRVVKITANHGCFFTMSSYEKIPETIKHNLRVYNIIEPDYKQIISSLLSSYGVNQGFADTEIIAKKLIFILSQLADSKIENSFFKNCLNLNLIVKIIKLIGKKCVNDKGRPDRTICMVLTFIFYPSIKTPTEKQFFNDLLKKTFNYEIINAIEEILTNALKEHLETEKMTIEPKQLQNMIDLYTSIRVNRNVVICGSPMSGKTTIIKTLLTTLNTLLQTNTNMSHLTTMRSNVSLKPVSERNTEELFPVSISLDSDSKQSKLQASGFLRRYSLLAVVIDEENVFPKVSLQALYPNMFDDQQLYGSDAYNDDGMRQVKAKSGLLAKLVNRAENVDSAANMLKLSNTNHQIEKFEKWLVMDTDTQNTDIFDKLSILNGSITPFNSVGREIPESVKILYETTSLDNLTPSVLNQICLIIQDKIDWKIVLESKLSILCVKFLLSTVRSTHVNELAKMLFAETEKHLEFSAYTSLLHSKTQLNKLNMLNFVQAFLNLLDGAFERHIESLNEDKKEMKDVSNEDTKNADLINCLCCFAYFWSFASFISSSSDVDNFNTFAVNLMIEKNCNAFLGDSIRLYECEINVKKKTLLPIKRTKDLGKNGDTTVQEYAAYSHMLELCIKSSKPILLYGDIGCGKTTFIEKFLANKYPYTKFTNMESHTSLHDSLIKHATLTKLRMNSQKNELNSKMQKFLYLIDDLNIKHSCAAKSLYKNRSFDLMRQLMETNSLYSFDDDYFISFTEFNYAVVCSTPPVSSSNYQSVSERLSRHFICINMNPNLTDIIQSIYLPTVQHWLEEFSVDALTHPIEMAEAIVKSLVEVFGAVKDQLKPTPLKPHYLFNMKDVNRVVQGLLLVASKSKIQKNAKKGRRPVFDLPPVTLQNTNIVRLLVHELHRVFMDRMSDENDENWFQTTVYNTVLTNFCTYRDDDLSSFNESSYELNQTTATDDDTEKPAKKAVKFKTGLVSERNATDKYRGILVEPDEMRSSSEEISTNVVFSKYVMRHHYGNNLENAVSERTAYFQSSINDLKMAAYAGVYSFEQASNTKMTFYFHNDALRHLSRLTRVLSLNRSHALLMSLQPGTGRTSLVRYAAHLSRMKYFEPRISFDDRKNEQNFRMTLKQCCLLSGIKKSHSIIYIKENFITHEILENLCGFIRTGAYPDLFTESEIWQIANKINPTIPATKRIDRTLGAYETFIKSIQDRLHVIISLNSTHKTSHDLMDTLRNHSLLTNEFYIDVYKPLKIEQIKSIACGFISDKLNDLRIKKYEQTNGNYDDTLDLTLNLDELTRDNDGVIENEQLDYEELHVYSSILANLHQIAYNHYLNVFSRSNYNIRPFVVSIFKQISMLFFTYIDRLNKHESEKLNKFQNVLKSVEYIQTQREKFLNEISKLNEHLVVLDEELKDSEVKIEQQKDAYRLANEECKKEEKLVEEMSQALEKLKSDTNQDFQDMNNQSNPQYEAALKALKSLDEMAFNELRSYRQPPQRVLAVVDALCVMFEVEPDWDNGKQLLIKENFYDQLLYYDKVNIQNEIFYKLERIVKQKSFTPDEVRPGSVAAASLCEWIIAVYEFCSIARVVNRKNKEISEFEELHKKRQIRLGEKRLFAEKERELLESYCKKRVNVLKEICQTKKRIENLTDSLQKAENLLHELDDDIKLWKSESECSSNFMCTHKTDALLAACYVSYAGIFDYEQRDKLAHSWFEYFKSTENFTKSGGDCNLSKYSIRCDFKFNDVVICECFDKDTIIQLNKITHEDSFLTTNALILREFYTYPTIHWPILFDPENYSLKLLSLLQTSIGKIKTPYIEERLEDLKREVKRRDSQLIGMYGSEDGGVTGGGGFSSRRVSEATIYGDQQHRSVSALSRRSYATQISDRSSIWETSTHVSRTNGSIINNTKTFLNAMLANSRIDEEKSDSIIITEVDGLKLPKNNLWVIDPFDIDIDNVLANAVVHGICVFLRNFEQFTSYSRFLEKLLNREFHIDQLQREYIKYGDTDFKIHPAFKLILHVNTPLHIYKNENHYLKSRLNYGCCAANGVLDLSLSYQYMANDLLRSVMDLEKAGYLNQCLSAEKMFIEAKFNIQSKHDEMMEKFVSIHKKFLTDKNVIKYVIDNNIHFKTCMDSQEEALYSMRGLFDKCKDYTKMSRTIAALFDALKYVLLVQPCYHVNWSTIKKLILREIPQILKDKGAPGPARASEVESFCLNKIYHYFSSSLSDRHFTELIFFHSFWKCIKQEWLQVEDENMKKIQKKDFKSAKPSGSNINEYKLYSSLENALKTSNTHIDSLNPYVWNKKPNFLTTSSWLNCRELEKTIPSMYNGLMVSLTNEHSKWQEYFNNEQSIDDMSQKDIDLLNDTPLKQSMNIFYKLLLWLNAQPNKISTLIKKFNVYNFGGFIPQHRHEFDLNFMLKSTTQHEPILVLHDPNENTFVDIKNEIIEKAKTVDAAIKVITFTLIDGPDSQKETSRLIEALNHSARHGNWIIIDNVHLIDNWSNQLLSIIYNVKDAKHQSLKELYADHQSSQNNTMVTQDTGIHVNHRLWFISDINGANNMPATLVYDSVKITAQISNFERTIKTCFDIASSNKELSSEVIEQTSILFSIIAHNNYSKAQSWRLQHFEEHLHQLNLIKTMSNSQIDSILQNLLVDRAYCTQAQSNIDATLLKNLISIVFDNKKKFDLKLWEKYSENLGSKIQYDYESEQMKKDFGLIFGVYKDITSYGDEERHIAEYVSIKNAINEKFNQNLIASLNETITKINETNSRIESFLAENFKTTDRNNTLIFDIDDYYQLFKSVETKLKQLLNCYSGESVMDSYDLKLFNRIFSNKETEKHFMESLNTLIHNVPLLIEQCENEEASVDLRILFNIKRYFNEFIEINYLSKINKVTSTTTTTTSTTGATPAMTLAEIMKIENKFFKTTNLGVCDFILEVYSTEDYSKSENDLHVKNLNLTNAYYDTFSNTFKTTVDNKFSSIINNCKLIPLLSKDTEQQQIDSQLQAIPFYVENLNNFVCNIYIKFDEPSARNSNSNTKNKSVVQNERKTFQNLIYFYTDCLASKLSNSLILN